MSTCRAGWLFGKKCGATEDNTVDPHEPDENLPTSAFSEERSGVRVPRHGRAGEVRLLPEQLAEQASGTVRCLTTYETRLRAHMASQRPTAERTPGAGYVSPRHGTQPRYLPLQICGGKEKGRKEMQKADCGCLLLLSEAGGALPDLPC